MCKETHVTLTALDSMLNSLSQELCPRFSLRHITMPPTSGHDCSSFSSSSFPRKPVPPVINITRPAQKFWSDEAMSSNSKQKGIKQHFEKHLYYMYESISFIWQEGLNTNLEQWELLTLFLAAVWKGF